MCVCGCVCLHGEFVHINRVFYDYLQWYFVIEETLPTSWPLLHKKHHSPLLTHSHVFVLQDFHWIHLKSCKHTSHLLGWATQQQVSLCPYGLMWCHSTPLFSNVSNFRKLDEAARSLVDSRSINQSINQSGLVQTINTSQSDLLLFPSAGKENRGGFWVYLNPPALGLEPMDLQALWGLCLSSLLLISQQCCINVQIDNDSYIKASERLEEIKWGSPAVSRKLNILLLLMESDLAVVPPCAHSSCPYLQNVGDIVNTGLINAGEHFKTIQVIFMRPTPEMFPSSSSVQLKVILGTAGALSHRAHAFITAAVVFAGILLTASCYTGQLVIFKHTSQNCQWQDKGSFLNKKNARKQTNRGAVIKCVISAYWSKMN